MGSGAAGAQCRQGQLLGGAARDARPHEGAADRRLGCPVGLRVLRACPHAGPLQRQSHPTTPAGPLPTSQHLIRTAGHPDRLPADGDGSLGAAGVHAVAAALGADVPLPHLPRALPVGAARRAQGGVARADRHDRLRLPRDAGHGHHRGLPADEGLKRRLHHQRPSKPHPCAALTGRRPHAVRRRRRRRSSAC